MSEKSDCCGKYIQLEVSCNLTIFIDELNCVDWELIQLKEEKQSLKVKKEKLHKQISFLKKC